MSTTSGGEQAQHGVVSRHDRETIARAMARAAGDGELDTQELQTRLEQAHRARTYDDLEALVGDLPEYQQPELRTIPEHTVPETLHITAALRNAHRRGRWQVPRAIIASAGQGEVELDFSEARFTDNAVTVDARPNWADIVLIVPDGATVTSEEAVPGASRIHDHTTAHGQAQGPQVHIVARPGLGSITVRHPRQHRGLFHR